MKTLSRICFASGVASILGSVALWSKMGKKPIEPQKSAHAERLAIFMGLWPPTFFILSNLFNQPHKEDGNLRLKEENVSS